MLDYVKEESQAMVVGRDIQGYIFEQTAVSEEEKNKRMSWRRTFISARLHVSETKYTHFLYKLATQVSVMFGTLNVNSYRTLSF